MSATDDKLRILRIITDDPGISSYQVHERLARPGWAARVFGPRSIMAALFGGMSIVYMHDCLEALEREGYICSIAGPRSAARGGRPSREYFPVAREDSR